MEGNKLSGQDNITKEVRNKSRTILFRLLTLIGRLILKIKRINMKPVVLLAHVKELQAFIRKVPNLDQNNLMEINKKLLKMQLEVSEIMEKF